MYIHMPTSVSACIHTHTHRFYVHRCMHVFIQSYVHTTHACMYITIAFTHTHTHQVAHEKKVLEENVDDSRSDFGDGTMSRQMVNDMEACVLLLQDKV
jgi:hypothetical protein